MKLLVSSEYTIVNRIQRHIGNDDQRVYDSADYIIVHHISAYLLIIESQYIHRHFFVNLNSIPHEVISSILTDQLMCSKFDVILIQRPEK